jgi:gp16 family phage-associated protein
MMKTSPPKTTAQFRKELQDADISVAEWARRNGVDKSDVYLLLKGTTNGTRGHARTVARAMGLALPPMRNADTKAAA